MGRRIQQNCKRGHPLSGDNLRVYDNARGGKVRICNACQVARSKVRWSDPEYIRKRVDRDRKRRQLAKEQRILDAAAAILAKRQAQKQPQPEN